jgi:hypothetical protein
VHFDAHGRLILCAVVIFVMKRSLASRIRDSALSAEPAQPQDNQQLGLFVKFSLRQRTLTAIQASRELLSASLKCAIDDSGRSLQTQ